MEVLLHKMDYLLLLTLRFLLWFLELLDNDLVSLMTCNKPENKVGEIKDASTEIKERRSKIVNVLKNVKKSDGELILYYNLF